MKVGFDLDGTLYDSLPVIYALDMEIIGRLGCPRISVDDYKSRFQSRDWRKFYRDLGVREGDLDKVIGVCAEEFGKNGFSS